MERAIPDPLRRQVLAHPHQLLVRHVAAAHHLLHEFVEETRAEDGLEFLEIAFGEGVVHGGVAVFGEGYGGFAELGEGEWNGGFPFEDGHSGRWVLVGVFWEEEGEGGLGSGVVWREVGGMLAQRRDLLEQRAELRLEESLCKGQPVLRILDKTGSILPRRHHKRFCSSHQPTFLPSHPSLSLPPQLTEHNVGFLRGSNPISFGMLSCICFDSWTLIDG